MYSASRDGGNTGNFLDDIDPDENFFNSLHPESDPSYCSKYYSAKNFNALKLDHSYNTTLINCNVRSFQKNGSNFLTVFQSLSVSPKYYVMTGTWCTEKTKQFCQVPGYSGVYTSRRCPGGGIAIFYQDHVSGGKVDHISFCNIDVETCVFRTNSTRNYEVIIGVYRPPSGSISGFLHALEPRISWN